MQKRVLVPLGPCARDLKSVHYALSLAERLKAQVYILQQPASPGAGGPHSIWLDEVLLDLINSARLAHLNVSHHIADGDLQGEILALVKSEGIDLLVFGEEDEACQNLLLQLKPLVPCQIIQVKEKDHIDKIAKEG